MQLQQIGEKLTIELANLRGTETRILLLIFAWRRSIPKVSKVKPVWVVLMLAVFAIASSHPILQGLGLIHQQTEHSHASGHEHSDSESDHPLADGHVSISVNRNHMLVHGVDGGVHVLPAIIAFAFSGLISVENFERLPMPGGTSPPPEIRFTWQVYSRTALPVRAPSCLS